MPFCVGPRTYNEWKYGGNESQARVLREVDRRTANAFCRESTRPFCLAQRAAGRCMQSAARFNEIVSGLPDWQ